MVFAGWSKAYSVQPQNHVAKRADIPKGQPLAKASSLNSARLFSLASLVLRKDALPERIPKAVLIVRRDGQPEVRQPPVRYHYRHRPGLEVVVQSGTGRVSTFASRRAPDRDALAKRLCGGRF